LNYLFLIKICMFQNINSRNLLSKA